jgi:hypothetical protein
MSKNLERVIQRAISDAAFRRQLQSNPEAALRGFNLTQSEVAALRSGDAGKLTSLGIDQRMSKTFTFSAAEGATRQAGTGDLGLGGSAALEPESASAAANRMVVPGYSGSASGVGDPGAGESTASRISDPTNPASARSYVGDAAPSSDALEEQSHAFAASRDQGASTASTMNDPDNPASARSYMGGGAAPSSDAVEDQSHAFAASRDQGASTASTMNDPDNPASARSYVGGQAAPSSDALEDQSHAFAATRSADVSGSVAAPIEGTPEEFAFRDQGTSASRITDPENPASARGFTGGGQQGGTDAFLPEGEVAKYSTDPNLSSDQAEDLGHTFNPTGLTAAVDDGDVADATSVHHQPDIPI